RDRDVRLMVVVRACADLVLPVSRTVIERIKRKPFVDGMFGMLILAYLGPRYALLFAAIFAVIAVVGLPMRVGIESVTSLQPNHRDFFMLALVPPGDQTFAGTSRPCEPKFG